MACRDERDYYLNIKRLTPSAVIPQYQTMGSSGADLCADEDVFIAPGEWAVIGTGLAMALSSTGYDIQIRPRSGLAAKHGVTVLNAPGTIDNDYRGEIKVILINHGKFVFRVCKGTRIAQMVIGQRERPWNTYVVTELDETDRGAGGFGSTGKD
jgi:dUTP pyrophosphatase